jgi:hypothetical protein
VIFTISPSSCRGLGGSLRRNDGTANEGCDPSTILPNFPLLQFLRGFERDDCVISCAFHWIARLRLAAYPM